MNKIYKLIRLFRKIITVFIPIRKAVMFESFGGKQYSDNPRAISEKLHELYPNFQIIWVMNKNSHDKYKIIPDYVKIVEYRSLEYFYFYAACFAHVTNEALELHHFKRRNQLFIQTWHGDRGFKKVLYACENESLSRHNIKWLDEIYTDLVTCGSDFGEKFLFRKAFNYRGEILKFGCPRNDKLIKNNYKEIIAIKSRLNLSSEVKILLYAPTYRDNKKNKSMKVQIDIDQILNTLEKKYKNKWICLVRSHIATFKLQTDLSDKIFDVSDYFDMSDILLISDMLITDYSSCACDFVLSNKPVLLAQFDKEDYLNNCRGFIFNLDDTPFFIAYSQLELINIIKEKTINDYLDNCRDISNFYDTYETGRASEFVCERLNLFYKKTYC